MKPILAIALALLCLTSITVHAATSSSKDVSPLLTPIIQKHDVPGIAAAVVRNGETVAVGVAGVRTRGKGDKVATADRFHIGSDTKAMTAMLCGILVDEGKLNWGANLGETFPELKKSMHPQYHAVTLEQLLTNRGGAPGDLAKDELWGKLWQHKGTPTSARRLLLQGVTSKPPEATPGTKYIYSNAGFSIAGHMAEKVTGKSWEALTREKIFRPLGMTTAGFGAPGKRMKNDQPRGHKSDGAPVEPGPGADNPVAIGPAGIVNCSIEDWSKFIAANLPSAKTKLVKPETLEKLHTSAPGNPKYAMGWIIADNQPWASGPALTHAGSNTMWYAVAWLAPNKDFAVLVACNQANPKACNDAVLALIADHFKAAARDEQPPATRPAVPINDAELFRTRIDEFLNAAQTKAGFSGAVLVARGGQPVYEGAFGISHLDSQAPNTLDTPFRIASLSKQFTAAAIFRLEGQGKLSIDDPVHQHLPEFAVAPYRDITIHHLLTHTSGLPRIATGLMGPFRWSAMSKAATPVDDYVRLAVQMPLEFEPGTVYQYSNFGYRVLAALIVRVTGREYADFMEQEIFRPLGMNDTGVARVTRPPSEARIAEGLTFLKLDRAGQPLFANGEGGRNFGTGYGSGGIYTSAGDLLRWDRALAGDEFLSASQKTRLFQPIHDNYACGWIVKESGLDGRLYQMHSGANQGFFSQMMRIPEDDLVIIAVGNVETTPAIDNVIDQLFRLCRSLPYQGL